MINCDYRPELIDSTAMPLTILDRREKSAGRLIVQGVTRPETIRNKIKSHVRDLVGTQLFLASVENLKINSSNENLGNCFYLTAIDSAITRINIAGSPINSPSLTENFVTECFAFDYTQSRTLNRFIEIVSGWKRSLAERQYEGIKKRLEFIFEDEPELSRNQKAPNAESFSALLAYLATNPNFKTPSLSFNRDGAFSASWQTNKTLKLTLEFIDLTRIRWVFVDLHQGLPNVISGAGVVPTTMLQSVLAPYGSFDWINIEG